ncbi:hypothetical protein [Tenacibaculum finnmarkense]|uniref:hypothetical protein n=1 Tax=Tenacibaculum finnmarkense TaxID=2781243 RepID=UPI001E2C3DA3|nr:hypothetical protein [Tenacibaculum finnmarkense]MCD8413572.1 hypothetical protein [Tenacibaculum finnmarkense genomovar ulcerans]
MEKIFRKRPFKTRNADEYNLSDILSLFVNPIVGLNSPLDFDNSIIKGRMGSGKTMYLRANYAYHLFNIVPRLLENEELILPVFIRLSDFQHIKDASLIYKEIIIKIVEELSTIYLRLQDAKEMANIHHGMRKIRKDIFFEEKLRITSEQLLKLGSEEYLKKVGVEFGVQGKASYNFLEIASNFKKNEVIEIKEKKNPGINDIKLAYETLLRDSGGKILLLIDEAGAVDKNFFKSESGDSFFEILMNQLRTADYIRTKIAIYPNSFSDILTETRYGDIVLLEENIYNEESLKSFRDKVESIIQNYLNIEFEDIKILPSDVFELNTEEQGDCIEEIINGSAGNYRRLIQILDLAMNESFKINRGLSKVSHSDANSALKVHCGSLNGLFSDIEKEYLNSLAKVCKSRNTFRFKFPNNTQVLYKYLSKSQEFNLLKVIEIGTGRKGTTYAFDYSYCVLKEIPTHNIRDTERIDKKRNLKSGTWISKVTNINNEIIAQTEIPNKIIGEVTYYKLESESGFVKGEDNIDYFFTRQYVIPSDISKSIWFGKRLRFNPSLLGDTKMATDIEII